LSVQQQLFCFCFPLFFGRSPFFGLIAFFATGLSVLYRPAPADFSFLLYLFSKKSMSKPFSKKSTKISMSVFPRFSGLYRVLRCFAAIRVQCTNKSVLQKNLVERFLPKKCFFVDFVLSRFWAFLGEGSSKTPLKKKIEKNWI
jgi:hypothetical protein